jgi:DNA transposase THAP9
MSRFPTDDERKRKWVVKLRRLDEDGRPWQPGPNAVLCSQHFLEDDFLYQWGRKLVKSEAVPTVFSYTKPTQKRKAPAQRSVEATVSEATGDDTVQSKRRPASESPARHVAGPSSSTPSSLHSYCVISPRKLKQHNEQLQLRLKLKTAALRNARRREQRLKGTVSSLLRQLKEQQLLSDAANVLLETYKDIPLDLFKARKHDGYTEAQKQFATTLHYYSPVAYSYVRKRFKHMPHPRTIRRWLSVFNAEPGLTQQSFDTIKACVQGSNSNAYKLCTLHIDEMEIKRQIEFDRRSGKVYGFTDIGCGALSDDSQPQATKVLLVVAVGVTGYWKLPVAYYLTDGANADLQTSIIKDVIEQLWECGCVAVSVTFDGLMANQKTLINLGGSLQPSSINSTFPHPCIPDVSVAVVFDACHMIKLARTLLNEYQIIVIPGVGKVKWQYIEALHKLQTDEGLTLANKLTKHHIQYKTQKMKVRLAVQVISASCATALRFLRTNGYTGFDDTAATELFLEKLDRLFDLLNVRTRFGTGYKAAITTSTARAKIAVLEEAKTFLLSLEDSTGKKLYDTKRRTCIIGFCATINSTVHLIETLLLNQAGVNGIHLNYILTHRTSQDHIETMFGLIRRRFGWNNNPTALQFSHAYRAILSKICAMPSSSANVTAENFVDETVDVDRRLVDCDDVFTADGALVDSEVMRDCLPALSHYVDNVCVYIAGFVVRRLLPTVKCTDCRELLVDCDGANDSSSAFLCLKDNGGLIKPSADVIRIVKVAEQNVRHLVSSDKPAHSIARLGIKLEHAVLSSAEVCMAFSNSPHLLDTADGIDSHVFSLVRLIVRWFLNIRVFHILRNWNISQKGTVVRQTLTKTVLFKNQ